MHTYAVKESFRTVQGEGHHAGMPALFIRFVGCNMWSGEEEDRTRDAQRNEAECPRWCDTDFRADELTRRFTAEQVVEYIVAGTNAPLIVLTGGEPLLQVDQALLDAIHKAAPMATIAIETNGTVTPKFDIHMDAIAPWLESPSWLWLTLSPKRSRERTKLPWAHELKLVVPAYDPAQWESYPALHHFMQPQAFGVTRNESTEHRTAMLVANGDGRWRLSLQTHKMVGVP